MTSRLPPQPGEWIDRSRLLSFRFEGKEYTGFAGDTVASALWAAGVRILGRSFKYHRPRGIFGLGGVDCNGVMESPEETNIRADVTPLREGMDLRAVNTRGGVERDRLRIFGFLGAFTPVGFYYKAFHTPKVMFPFYERRIRRIAGLGRVHPHRKYEPTPKDYAFCDLLVVGAGPAGLSAALAAAGQGVQVLLVDENRRPGGTLCYRFGGGSAPLELLSGLLEEIRKSPTLELRTSTTAAGHYADRWVALVDERRLTKVRARAVLVAGGCHEQPAVFRNDDLPGVMLSGAAQRLIRLYSVKPFERAVVLTANRGGYRVALDLHGAGVEVAALVDLRPEGELTEEAAEVAELGIPLYPGHAICEALPRRGGRGVRAVAICPLGPAGEPEIHSARTLSCDGVVVSVGWAPADGLLRQAGGRMEYCKVVEQFVPRELPPGLFAAGRVNGIYALERQLEDGRRAGQEAAAYLGFSSQVPGRRPQRAGPSPSHPYPVVHHPRGKDFVDLDEDLQLEDIENAVREGFDSPELLKRYATVGMGPSQGKHSNLPALRILTRLRGEEMEGRQVTTARPFTTPVPLGHLAGRIFTPVRRTPIHPRHQALGARFMYAGNWLRPEYYARNGLAREACVGAEVRDVRRRVGLIDLGTLGKLEIGGPDAVAFIERIYTGLFAGLKVGMARYGVVCDEAGVAIDDGMIARLGDRRFYVSTTTTGAEGVYREMQRWAVLWNLEVVLANATNHYGALNLAGPFSRKVLEPLTDANLEPESFPYLAVREGRVAGVPARLCRVGFVGEWGYEIHLPADAAPHVWDSLMEAGKPFGIRPFGVEAQRLLRLEKGHPIIGQDTDGLTHPFEAGMGWAVKMKKPFFVGQRSLEILQRKPLKRLLVGFVLPRGFRGPVPKECHLVVEEGELCGRVTSVAFSPTLERVIGLAFVRPDRAEPGSRIAIRVEGGVLVEATVAPVPFFDPRNTRQTRSEEWEPEVV